MASETMRCRKCGAVLTDGRPILRGEDWAQCGSVRDCYAGKSETDDIAAVSAKLEDIAAHVERLDSGSGDAAAFRLCARYLKQQQADIERLSVSYEALHQNACRLEEKTRAMLTALAKAHEIAEVSECRIAEVYDRLVKARDLLHVSESLAPGAVSNEAFSRIQDVFELLQEAKYGLSGRQNVAWSIATLRKDIA